MYEILDSLSIRLDVFELCLEVFDWCLAVYFAYFIHLIGNPVDVDGVWLCSSV